MRIRDLVPRIVKDSQQAIIPRRLRLVKRFRKPIRRALRRRKRSGRRWREANAARRRVDGGSKSLFKVSRVRAKQGENG
ncbi:hypothetical protein [Chromobacterium haemolyticum]|uniref:hypothetical protein n=1 Tax=Chromobacterium haemolyticum TaxID=394935 RepID=UPI0011323E98|nr:hypothetical protein [Chromobacterium haemolyticum]